MRIVFVLKIASPRAIDARRSFAVLPDRPDHAANIVIALVLGAILAVFYIWRRDLKANMFGHFLVDFVGNVLPKLVP
jgi:capsular polysaccharide biosynthesis protein